MNLPVQFFSRTGHLSDVHWSPPANGYCVGQCRSRTFPSEKLPLGTAVLGKVERELLNQVLGDAISAMKKNKAMGYL